MRVGPVWTAEWRQLARSAPHGTPGATMTLYATFETKVWRTAIAAAAGRWTAARRGIERPGKGYRRAILITSGVAAAQIAAIARLSPRALQKTHGFGSSSRPRR